MDVINKNIVVVEIDDKSFNRLWFPLDREDYIPFLENIKQAQPAVVGFDILFLDPSRIPKKDIDLADKFQELGNVVLWFDIKDQFQAILPYEMFRKSIHSLWYFQPFENPYTKKVASIEPYRELRLNGENQMFDSFSIALLRAYFQYMYAWAIDTKNVEIWKWYYESFAKRLPVVSSELLWIREVNEMFIHYTSPDKFQRESFYNIYTWNFDKNLFKDKIVLIWYTAQGVKDDFVVPHYGTIKWVYVHANAMNNILNENYIVYFNKNLELLISFLFILSIVYINVHYLRQKNLRWIAFWAIFLFLFIFWLYFILFLISFQMSGIYLIPNFPFEFLSVLGLSFFVSSVLKYMNEDKNKKRLSQALSEYVSQDIAKEILYSSGNINLSWENKKITIFFSDIAGFTTISEKLSPEDLVLFLRIYLWQMSDIIMDHKWFINKYEWDAIMALWWVFGKNEDFGMYQACISALLQQKQLQVLNQEFIEQWKTPLQVRMGIHTWNAIIGNIWSEWRKMEFTALWDSVNLASRLEWVNKFYYTNICVSEDVYEWMKEIFTFRYLDKIRVKWKNNFIHIYELISVKDEESNLQKEIILKFWEAIWYYTQREFQKAYDIFAHLSEIWDGPSKTYKERCVRYIVNPPNEDWDGVWVLDEK